MPLPKRRHSSTRRDKRRANDTARVPAVSFCPECKEPKPPHKICPSCGSYKGREVIKAPEKE